MGKRGFSQLIYTTVASLWVGSAAVAGCDVETVSVRGDFGTAQFTVTVADDPDERAQGLMFVENMASMEGMLFVYERPQRVSFWMRNTLIPLDMIFVDASGVVRNIHPMAQPLDETTIFGGDAIQFVLEINGGMADQLGLEVGDAVQHPSLGSDAVWSCPLN